ncbi:VOC family protein [Tepidibacter aestuarii]|uniref:VOC family protein n=1 Tax=Tepidibacter aestuarii TaxID=2925782 RepID=UPI0020BD5358|nr:VOC family protein [Tepidibacter aestuarii]CAH2212823.1 Glyoxalase [Tepidibacter aestuarii]
MFKRIDHIAFIVEDRTKSINFYEEHFGFKKYYEHDVPIETVEKIVYLKLGDTTLELIHIPNGSINKGFHFCLESDNFDEDYIRLIDAGIPVDTKPHPVGAREIREKGWRRVVFIGPDEELIEFRG